MSADITKEQLEELGIVDERVDVYFKVENSVIDGYQAMEEDKKTKKLKKVKKSYFDNPYEIVLFTALSRYCNNGKVAFPSLDTLKIVCCCSKPTLIKAIKSLEEKGFIKKINRKNSETNGNQSNLYAIKNINEIKVNEINASTVSSKGDLQGDSKGDLQGDSKGDLHKEEQVYKNKNIYKNKNTYNVLQFGINKKGFQNKDKWEKFLDDNLQGINYNPLIEKAILKNEEKEGEKNTQNYLLETYSYGINNNLDIDIIGNMIVKMQRNDKKNKTIKSKNKIIKEIKELNKKEKIQYVKDKLSQEELEAIYNSIKKEFNGLGVSEESSILSEMNEVLFRKYKKIAV